MCKRMVMDIELFQVCSILVRRDGLKSDVTWLENWMLIPILYEGVYESCEHVEKIKYFLSHFDSVASYDKWMIIPKMKFLILSHYKVLLFFYHDLRIWFSYHLELNMSLLLHANSLQLVVNNNPFIELYLRNGHLVPPLAYKWYENRLSSVEG